MQGLGEGQWIEHSREKKPVRKGPEVEGSKVHLWNKESSVWVETSSQSSEPSVLELRVANTVRLLESPFPFPTPKRF